jgi:hypothetical protein
VRAEGAVEWQVTDQPDGAAMAVSMFDYDQARVLDALKALPPRERQAFAAAAATRMVPACERFAAEQSKRTEGRVRQIAAELWQSIEANDEGQGNWVAVLAEVMAMIPGEEAEGGLVTQLAEDGFACLAYAIRCLLTDEAQEAARAAGREYDACDQAAIALTGIVPKSAKQEAKILAHPLVQRGLGRQHEDMTLLRQGGIGELQRLALAHPAFTEQELTALSSVK